MTDTMLKAAQAAYDGNAQFIEILAMQLKDAKERQKVLREAVKREKAHFKGYSKAMKVGAVSIADVGGGVAVAPVVRRYVDNYKNKKLGRVGQVIPSRKKVVA
jgi:hypothetical protein